MSSRRSRSRFRRGRGDPAPTRHAAVRRRTGGARQRGRRRAVPLARGAGRGGRPPRRTRVGDGTRRRPRVRARGRVGELLGPPCAGGGRAPNQAPARPRRGRRGGAGAPRTSAAQSRRRRASGARFCRSEPAYEESLRIFTELGDVRGAASIRMRLAYIASARGRRSMQELLDESLRDANGRFAMIEIQGVLLLTHAAVDDGRFDDADLLLRRCEELRARFAWRWYDTIVASLRMWRRPGTRTVRGGAEQWTRGIPIHVEENRASRHDGAERSPGSRTSLSRPAGSNAQDCSERRWSTAKLGGHTGLRARGRASPETRPAFLEASARGRRSTCTRPPRWDSTTRLSSPKSPPSA